MAIHFACECGKKLAAREEFAGRQMKCPQCGRALAIPRRQTAAVGAGTGMAHTAPVADERTAQGPHTPPPEAAATEPVLEAFTETTTAPEPMLVPEPAEAVTAEPVVAVAPAAVVVAPTPRESHVDLGLNQRATPWQHGDQKQFDPDSARPDVRDRTCPMRQLL